MDPGNATNCTVTTQFIGAMHSTKLTTLGKIDANIQIFP